MTRTCGGKNKRVGVRQVAGTAATQNARGVKNASRHVVLRGMFMVKYHIFMWNYLTQPCGQPREGLVEGQDRHLPTSNRSKNHKHVTAPFPPLIPLRNAHSGYLHLDIVF